MIKKIFLLIGTFLNLLIVTSVPAQTPQAFKYQAIARNNSGAEMPNTNLQVRVSIHDQSANGTIVYQETFSVITNPFGLFNLNIGQGTPTTGTFSAIAWGNGSKFIEQEIDLGNGFQSIGTSQLLSVPYALYAENSGTTNGWSLTGNPGTHDSLNFIGTTDPQPLNFRVNNQNAGRIDADQNMANTFFGYEAGNSNIAGAGNTIYGQKAFRSNINGYCNTATGSHALFWNTSGYWNTVSGYYSMYFNKTGQYNTATGCWALGKNTSGSYNTAHGMNALELSKTGTGNTAAGFASLSYNSTGDYNTAVGYGALTTNYTGHNNTALGYSANVTHTNLTNATAIGANAKVSASNCLVLGDSANVGIGVNAPTAKLEVAGQVKITGGTPGAGKVLTSDSVGLASWQNISSTGATGWSVIGNSGTIDTINFIGTTDNVPLNFRVNNQKAGRIETSFPFNTFFGLQAGNSNVGTFNTAMGWRALFTNTTGSSNTAFGERTLFSNLSGYYNVASGIQALYSNTSGNSNVATGFNSMFQNTSGSNNSSMGVEALRNNMTGHSNVAIGAWSLVRSTDISNLVAIGDSALYNNGVGTINNYDGVQNTAIGSKALFSNTRGYCNTSQGYKSMYFNTTGFANTAIGNNALYDNTSGYYNTAVGSPALPYNSTGEGNTAVGAFALEFLTTGNHNTAIGSFAGVQYLLGANIKNSTAIGASTLITASNQIRLGDNTPGMSIGGFAAWTNLSDGRFKKDIQENVPGLSLIMKLRPVTYQFDIDKMDDFLQKPDSLRSKVSRDAAKNYQQTGFIAQEVENAASEIGYDFSGVDKPKNENDYYGLRYSEFVVPLVKAVQEQQALIQELEKKMAEQKTEIDELKRLLGKKE